MPVASIPNLNWGSIADWVSGIGSLAAATVALYVALSSQRVKLRGYCGLRLIIGGQEPKFEVFSVSVTNISQRPTVITNVGFTFGLFRWKRHGLEYALTLVRRRLQANNQIVDRLPIRPDTLRNAIAAVKEPSRVDVPLGAATTCKLMQNCSAL